MSSDPRFHQGYVQTIGDPPRGFFAVCPTCGPDLFPDRDTRDAAQADVESHEAAIRGRFYVSLHRPI